MKDLRDLKYLTIHDLHPIGDEQILSATMLYCFRCDFDLWINQLINVPAGN